MRRWHYLTHKHTSVTKNEMRMTICAWRGSRKVAAISLITPNDVVHVVPIEKIEAVLACDDWISAVNVARGV